MRLSIVRRQIIWDTSRLKIREVLARLGCDVMRLADGAARRLSIRIRDRSTPNDLGYSGIFGMPLDNSDLEFLALLANECCIEIRCVASIDALP